MKDTKVLDYIVDVLENMPEDWLKLTTHRLDIYDEAQAKTQFLEQFEKLYQKNTSTTAALEELPTAFDYIRLGHPLSSILEWSLAKLHHLNPNHVISFSSRTVPVLSILRKNLLDNKKTRILYEGELPEFFEAEALKDIYGYHFELSQLNSGTNIPDFDGSTILFTSKAQLDDLDIFPNVDFLINHDQAFGSILAVLEEENHDYVSEIQHVRRRETIAMTPANSYSVLLQMTGQPATTGSSDRRTNKTSVLKSIEEITGSSIEAVLASSGLSMQYAIMMGLIDDAMEKHPGKDIKFIVPPNCYGGTNDQARRIAACLEKVEVVDLPVDGNNDMVKSIDTVLDSIAGKDAVPYIIAEIPTNPRVEVPDLKKLQEVLSKSRETSSGDPAIAPVFILDQTFCPNVQFLSKDGILSAVKTISYVSGSKFPSGGKCTAGYCVANLEAEPFISKINKHIRICDNEATDLQVEILAKQLPSMNQRIEAAYKNTRAFVNYIKEVLPAAKINFVSEDLAKEGFTPSVFSLDLPTKGETEEERENYKRALNQKLINLMINNIPEESKYCVSYGQLKGCYWTIPATSTQGTTKEDDKDYIARVALSPNMDLERHKEVFKDFVSQM